MRHAKKFKPPRWNNCGDPAETQVRLRRWYQQLPGRLLLQMEREVLEDALPTLFGYHILQIGLSEETKALQASRILHRVVMDRALSPALDGAESGGATPLQGSAEALPFSADSLDVVILNHSLEFSRDPHQVLREVDRVLIPEGHVVVLGFNPNSLWMIWRLLLGWKSKPPWCGSFIRPARLRDWLQLLGFDIIDSHFYFFRPPLSNEKALNRLRFVERMGRFGWMSFGGAYMIVARKRVATMTPLKPRWRLRRSRVASPGLVGNTPMSSKASEQLTNDE